MNQIFISAQNFDLFWSPNCKVLVAKFLCKKSNSILPNSGAFPANSNQQHPKSSCCPRLGNALETPDFWVPPPLTCWKWERERERSRVSDVFVDVVSSYFHDLIAASPVSLLTYATMLQKSFQKPEFLLCIRLMLPIHLTTIPTENALLVHHGPPAFSAQVGFEGLGSSAPLAERWWSTHAEILMSNYVENIFYLLKSKSNSARQLFKSGKTGTSGQSTFDASSLAWSLPPWCSDNPTSKGLDMFRLPHRNASCNEIMLDSRNLSVSDPLHLATLVPRAQGSHHEGGRKQNWELNSFQEIKIDQGTAKHCQKGLAKDGVARKCQELVLKYEITLLSGVPSGL